MVFSLPLILSASQGHSITDRISQPFEGVQVWLTRDLAQLLPQMCACLHATVEIRHAEFLVGTMCVIVILAPAEQQRVDAQFVLERVTIGIDPPSRMKTGGHPKPRSIAGRQPSCRGCRAEP